MADFLFTYGTLMSGQPAAYMLRSAELIGPGRIQARLYDFGAFPAAMPGAQGDVVFGELYRVSEPMLESLDRYEGFQPDSAFPSLYKRVRARVYGPDGLNENAWVYFCDADYFSSMRDDSPRIESGDWLDR